MKRQKLEFRFHNPNTAEVTAEYIAKVIVEANQALVERYIHMQKQANCTNRSTKEKVS